ncbi:ferredoxin [Micromonospora sp. NPDC050397]|uniref:ferredoxin n=1 Tax=Micromonospora sp. NPDC050397 TaxID=3364279 RepID=UPI00384D3EF3
MSDSGACAGAGVCASVVPTRFKLVDGYGEPIEPEVEPDDQVLLAANLCPMGALRVTDAATGELLAPEDD